MKVSLLSLLSIQQVGMDIDLYANLLYYYCFVEIRSTGADKPCLYACRPQNLDDKFCNGTIAERILCQRTKSEHHMLLFVEENDEVKRSFHSDTKLCSTSGQRAVLASQPASCALATIWAKGKKQFQKSNDCLASFDG
ncbi:hypothetical protein T05_5552 [Trichinella murrelli]|uniref:Uncharacterized protein n=1 Tax=Trichinella murrelli TaxID=144512 RepID=A0A0V0T7Q6_9BILA|nr:hypothetical protein T05_5552 [Trichinella murrelli]